MPCHCFASKAFEHGPSYGTESGKVAEDKHSDVMGIALQIGSVNCSCGRVPCKIATKELANVFEASSAGGSTGVEEEAPER